MARFLTETKPKHTFAPVIPLVLFIAAGTLFLRSTNSFSEDSNQRREAYLTEALNRSVTYCYATEGAYPQNLAYLKEHYGLIWDEEKYYVDYRVIGANIYPEITVITLDREGH